MFVRWKRRERTRTRGGYKRSTGEWVKSAVLIQSVRTEAGPRHKHICYLSSIWEGHEKQHWHRVGFWETAERNLDRAGISKKDRVRIVAALQSIVSKPDKKSLASEATWWHSRKKRLST
jgi:hypothetical protein